MSHDTHDTHAHHHNADNDKPVIAFNAAFYFVLILAGLFVAALGFVKSSNDDSAGHNAHGAQHVEAASHTEHGAAATHEAAHIENTHEENGVPATTPEHHETAPAEHH